MTLRSCIHMALLALASVTLVTVPMVVDAQVLINEFLTSNVEGIPDEDGDSPDWIELLNTGAGAVELGGWHLSDDPQNPLLWTLPPYQLPAGERLLIYASGKDRDYLPAFWETVIDRGDIWSYTVAACEQGSDWIDLGYDDGEWNQGPTGIGYGDGDDETMIGYTSALFTRHIFEVEDPAAVSSLVFHIDYDDAFVAYINGVEIARKNIGLVGVRPECDELAINPHEAEIYDGGLPTYFMVDAPEMLVAGDNVMAIELHNESPFSSDLSLIPWLTLGLDTPPSGGGEGPAEYIRFMLPHLHTDFGLGNGEIISLRDGGGTLVDETYTGMGWADISRGRAPDGGEVWTLFTEPTPDAPNGAEGYTEFASPPFFSHDGGFLTAPISLEIYTPLPGVEIRYTVDGSDPDQTSRLYDIPITIPATRIVRARCFETGKLPSRIATASYLFGVTTDLPVVSLVTDPDNLWDWESGIYVLGPDANPGHPYYGANFWQDWEKPAHIEFFETDGTTPFAHDLGIKIHGGMSRALPQKSLRLIARGGYGASRFEHRIFADTEVDRFKTLILRNAGNDWCVAQLRDLFMQRVCARPESDIQSGRQAVVYLNGDYWGIHNLRERLDQHYLENHHGVNPEAVDILEDDYWEIEGDAEAYLAMMDWIDGHDLALPENYAAVQEMMEVDNYTLYNCCEIYFANTDWPHGNIRYWRSREPVGKWRWMFKDMDIGLGYWDGVSHNTLAHALAEDGGSTNPPWSTFLLRSLMANPLFKRDFINTYAELMSGPLETVTLTGSFDLVTGNIAAEIEPHFDRWERDYNDWYGYTDNIRNWIRQRPAIAKQHLMQQFGLPDTLIATMAVLPVGAGSIRLTATEVDSMHSICYFQGNTLPVTAASLPGWTFDHWAGVTLPDTSSVTFTPTGNFTLIAHFREVPLDEALVVINEINYNSAVTFDPGDWIEFHNPGDADLDLTGWSFRDSEDIHIFNFPQGTTLAAEGYLVLSDDLTAFHDLFPEVDQVLGGLNFGFSGGGELLRLYDAEGQLYDSVAYDDLPPWPTAPDGGGPTLELVDPLTDNSLPENWGASTEHGTPGERNSVFDATSSPAPAVPTALGLDPPWPNPFNPTTNIRFAIPESGPVKLTVYDLQGRLVTKLVDGQMVAGFHRTTWHAAGLSSGVYLMRLRSGGESRSGKLLLLK